MGHSGLDARKALRFAGKMDVWAGLRMDGGTALDDITRPNHMVQMDAGGGLRVGVGNALASY